MSNLWNCLQMQISYKLKFCFLWLLLAVSSQHLFCLKTQVSKAAEILGYKVGARVTTDDAKRRYWALAQEHHPDKHISSPPANKKEHEEIFKNVANAWECLSEWLSFHDGVGTAPAPSTTSSSSSGAAAASSSAVHTQRRPQAAAQGSSEAGAELARARRRDEVRRGENPKSFSLGELKYFIFFYKTTLEDLFAFGGLRSDSDRRFPGMFENRPTGLQWPRHYSPRGCHSPPATFEACVGRHTVEGIAGKQGVKRAREYVLAFENALERLTALATSAAVSGASVGALAEEAVAAVKDLENHAIQCWREGDAAFYDHESWYNYKERVEKPLAETKKLIAVCRRCTGPQSPYCRETYSPEIAQTMLNILLPHEALLTGLTQQQDPTADYKREFTQVFDEVKHVRFKCDEIAGRGAIEQAARDELAGNIALTRHSVLTLFREDRESLGGDERAARELLEKEAVTCKRFVTCGHCGGVSRGAIPCWRCQGSSYCEVAVLPIWFQGLQQQERRECATLQAWLQRRGQMPIEETAHRAGVAEEEIAAWTALAAGLSAGPLPAPAPHSPATDTRGADVLSAVLLEPSVAAAELAERAMPATVLSVESRAVPSAAVLPAVDTRAGNPAKAASSSSLPRVGSYKISSSLPRQCLPWVLVVAACVGVGSGAYKVWAWYYLGRIKRRAAKSKQKHPVKITLLANAGDGSQTV